MSFVARWYCCRMAKKIFSRLHGAKAICLFQGNIYRNDILSTSNRCLLVYHHKPWVCTLLVDPFFIYRRELTRQSAFPSTTCIYRRGRHLIKHWIIIEQTWEPYCFTSMCATIMRIYTQRDFQLNCLLVFVLSKECVLFNDLRGCKTKHYAYWSCCVDVIGENVRKFDTPFILNVGRTRINKWERYFFSIFYLLKCSGLK